MSRIVVAAPVFGLAILAAKATWFGLNVNGAVGPPVGFPSYRGDIALRE